MLSKANYSISYEIMNQITINHSTTSCTAASTRRISYFTFIFPYSIVTKPLYQIKNKKPQENIEYNRPSYLGN